MKRGDQESGSSASSERLLKVLHVSVCGGESARGMGVSKNQGPEYRPQIVE